MVECHPSAAGVEHYREVTESLDFPMPAEVRTGPIHGPRPRNLHLGGTPIAMTIRMVGGLIPTDSVLWKIAARAPDSMEYEVAGTMLWMLSLPEWIVDLMNEWGWLDVPLIRWKDLMKEPLISIRRYGMMGRHKDDAVYLLRKMINVTYRRDNEADWEKEKGNRQGRAWHKMLLGRGRYYDKLMKHVMTYERRQVQNLNKRADNGDMDDWWTRRHHSTPGGSTSAGGWGRSLLREDPRFGANDRPNKKTIVEALPEGVPRLLMTMPTLYVARASTKHEPGDKRRALYAVNDLPYLVSAFASANAEKEADMPGISARQTPEDFIRWLADSTQLPAYWLSSDYDDYNKEHTLEELSIINICRSRAWSELHSKGKAAADKAAAHAWLANAMLQSFITWPKGATERVWCGLFSGGRDTMRDHCTIHNADVRIIREDAASIGYRTRLAHPTRGEHEAGDDEDIAFHDPLSAAVYGRTALLQNHELNPRKQLAGAAHHEYLQVLCHPGSKAQRPLAAMLATLSTGNWYVPSAMWLDSIIQGVADNWWETTCRGLPPAAAQHMACAYLDTMMRIHDDVRGGWTDLEWWSYRSPGYAHPLWGVVTESPPVVRRYPGADKSWPCQATDAWMERNKRMLLLAPRRKREEYRESLLQSSHGSAFLQYRQSQLRAEVRHNWPERVERRYTIDMAATAPGFSPAEMVQLAHSLRSTGPRSLAEQASRMGMDPEVLALVGGYGQLAKLLPGNLWSRYATVVPAHELTPRAASSSWAFRSMALRASAKHPLLHKKPVDSSHVLIYVYAANGAGKTWLVERNAGWMDMDAIARPIGLDKPAYKDGLENASARHIFIGKVLRRAVEQSAIVVLGQWNPREITAVASGMSMPIRILAYEPGYEVRVARLMARGWSEDKIARRAKRWVVHPEACRTVEELTAKVRGL